MTSPISTKSARVFQQKRPGSTMPRKIIPAIPLFYVQKRQQYQAERAKARQSVGTVTPSTVVDETQIVHQSILPPPKSPATTPVQASEAHGATENSKPCTVAINGFKQENISEAAEINLTTPATTYSNPIENQENDVQKTLLEESKSEKQDNGLADDSIDKLNLDKTKGHCPTSCTNYQFPPDFVPLNQPQSIHGMGSESARFPPPETLGVNFRNLTASGYSESNNSSSGASISVADQAPPSKHIYPSSPRNHTHQSTGAHPYHMASRYSPMGPPLPLGYYPHNDLFTNTAPANEIARGPIPSFRLAEGFSTIVSPIDGRPCDPITPHSFHGSQSSAHDHDRGLSFLNQRPPSVIQNGCSGYVDEFRHLQTKPFMNPTRDQCIPPFPPAVRNYAPQMDNFDGLHEYLSSQFADPTFADYTLELRYSDDRAAPARIPGHNLMLARSRTLREMILAARRESEGLAFKTLLIESGDRFLCTDGFYMAMHRLYGNPLLDIGPIIQVGPPGQYQIPPAYTTKERFNLAIGYAAAGHLLKLNIVVSRGCEIAGLALNWTTMEKGLDFALDGGLEPQWTAEGCNRRSSGATYGPSVNMILHKVIEYICQNFPADFQLDTSVGDDIRFVLRLPNISTQRQSSSSSRLGLIKFGDHTSEESQQNQDFQAPSIILSRVLINLPWEILRCLFESPCLNNVSGNAALRHQIMSSVVLEREKQRLKVYNSHVPNTERRTRNQEWAAVGWREEVSGICGDDHLPKLTRSWVDFNIPET